MKSKEWFVILQQKEFEKCLTSSQVAVFLAIKSYSSNGKKEIGLSFREIAKRARATHPYVRKVVTQLIANGLIKITGSETRRGGTVNTYEVLTTLPVNSTEVVTQLPVGKGEVVTAHTLSGNSSGTKNGQSNKVNINKLLSYKNQKKSSEAGPQEFTPKLEEKLWHWAEVVSEKGGNVNV